MRKTITSIKYEIYLIYIDADNNLVVEDTQTNKVIIYCPLVRDNKDNIVVGQVQEATQGYIELESECGRVSVTICNNLIQFATFDYITNYFRNVLEINVNC